MDRRIVEDQKLVLQLLKILKPFDKSTNTLINTSTGEKWTKYEFEDVESGEDVYGLYKLPKPTTKELIDIIIFSNYFDEVEGAAGLLLYDEWAQRKEFREELLSKLEILFQSDKSDLTFKKIMIVVDRAELLKSENKRDVIGKNIEEINSDHEYFLKLSQKVSELIKEIEKTSAKQ